jgi:hypothetical protein
MSVEGRGGDRRTRGIKRRKNRGRVKEREA